MFAKRDNNETSLRKITKFDRQSEAAVRAEVKKKKMYSFTFLLEEL